MLLEPLAAHGPQVEPEVIHLPFAHAPHQGAADGVAGGQVAASQLGHRASPIAIHQPGAFAAHGFGDQEVGRPRQHQGRGVELHEFQVAD